MTWGTLTEQEKNRVAYDFLQSEGFDGNGNEYETPEDYYNGTRLTDMPQNANENAIIACEQGKITGAN